jgi:hypothetical protein
MDMTLESLPRGIPFVLTATSFVLAMVSIQLGRKLNYLDHLPVFNSLALVMLALVLSALVVAVVQLVKARERSASPWVAVTLALFVLSSYLLDD